jgi:hypothetical protein
LGPASASREPTDNSTLESSAQAKHCQQLAGAKEVATAESHDSRINVGWGSSEAWVRTELKPQGITKLTSGPDGTLHVPAWKVNDSPELPYPWPEDVQAEVRETSFSRNRRAIRASGQRFVIDGEDQLAD